MMGRYSVMLSLLALVAGCAGLPGAVKPIEQAFAPAYVQTPMVRAHICGRDDVAPAGRLVLAKADG